MADSFTISPVLLPLRSPFVTLDGTKDPTVTKVYLNADSAGTRYPTPSSWEIDHPLNPGENRLELQAEDLAGNKTAVILLILELPKVTTEAHEIWNPLDDKALEIQIERIPGEKNLYLKNRVLDAEKNLANATYAGLVRAISRELSLDLTADALTITPIEDTSSRALRATEAHLTIEPTRLLLEAKELRKEKEKLRIDPGSLEGTLAEIPLSKADLKLQGLDGKPLEAGRFEILDEKKVRVREGSPLLLLASYPYLKEIQITSSTTLANLEASIEAVVGAAGTALFTGSVKSGETGKRADRLVRVVRALIPRDGLKLALAQFRLNELHDEKFRKGLLNEYGTYLATRLEAYARISRARGRIFIQDTILDVDELLEHAADEALLSLPHLFDPVIRWHRCADPADTARYPERDRARGPNLCPKHTTKALSPEGIRKVDFQSGPGSALRMVKVK